MTILHAFIAIFGIAAAQAATHPQILPLRDVAVTYTLSAPDRADARYQLSYDAAGERARIDDPAHGTFFLADLPEGTAQLVVPALQSIIAMPALAGIAQEISTAGNASFTRIGQASYAGRVCETYLVRTSNGAGNACLTADGVILHFSGHDAHGSATVTATQLAYAPQDPANFAAPAGFSSISLPPAALAQFLGQQ